MGLVALGTLFSAGAFTALILAPNGLLKIILGLALGLGISVMFVVGHDACHDSLTPSTVLNRVLGRLCFLPTLHPYVAWELGHNQLHHGWTNLKGVDYVYPPFSPEEFRQLPAWRRSLERIYRTTPGIGLFYFLEVWWKHMIAPRAQDLARMRGGARAFAFDAALVLGFLGAEALAAVWFAPSGLAALLNLGCAVILPYAIWNWLMAFITVQHHTHPLAPWFKDVKEWTFFHGQIHGTIHVKLPRWIEILFHNILDHTAHHVDPKIPLYHLTDSQRRLENRFPKDVVIEHTSLAALRRVLRTCKLYDYDRHCWLDFQGRPTAPPIPLSRRDRPNAPAGAVLA